MPCYMLHATVCASALGWAALLGRFALKTDHQLRWRRVLGEDEVVEVRHGAMRFALQECSGVCVIGAQR